MRSRRNSSTRRGAPAGKVRRQPPMSPSGFSSRVRATDQPAFPAVVDLQMVEHAMGARPNPSAHFHPIEHHPERSRIGDAQHVQRYPGIGLQPQLRGPRPAGDLPGEIRGNRHGVGVESVRGLP